MPTLYLPATSKTTKADALDINDSLEGLRDGLAFLLNRYMKHQSKTVASKIVKQLEMMLSHHDCIEFPTDRCSFYHLLRYWRAKSI